MSNSNQKLIKKLFKSWKLWTEEKEEKEEKEETPIQSMDFEDFPVSLPPVTDTVENFDAALEFAKDFKEKIKSEPELEKNIIDSKKIVLKGSKLMFDGRHLHWLTQGRVFKSWPATSGHFQDLFVTDVSVEIALNVIKILKNGLGKDLRAIRDEIEDFIRLDIFKNPDAARISTGKGGLQIVTELVEAFWEVEYETKSKIKTLWSKPLGKKKEPTDSTKFINGLGDLLAFFGLSNTNVDVNTINAATRRKRTADKNFGPIPEGRYAIIHNLQEAPMKGGHDAYIGLLAAVKAYQKSYEVGEWSPEIKALAKEVIPQSVKDNITSDLSTGEDFGAVNLAVNMATGEMVPNSASILSTIPWGNYRVRISKINKGAAHLATVAQSSYKKRNRFYIHGGSLPGSGGCIDLGNHMEDFAQFWSLAGVTEIVKSRAYGSNEVPSGVEIPLEVNYLDDEKRKLLTQNKIAQKYEQIVFTPE